MFKMRWRFHHGVESVASRRNSDWNHQPPSICYLNNRPVYGMRKHEVWLFPIKYGRDLNPASSGKKASLCDVLSWY